MIRAAAPDDLAAIRDLLAAAGLPTSGVDAAEAVVLVDDDRVVGAAALERHDGDALLRSVVVDPAHRGTGAGRALVADRLATAGGDVYLLTTTAADWFARLGFAAIARDDAPAGIRASEEFASLCPASAVVMRRLRAGEA